MCSYGSNTALQKVTIPASLRLLRGEHSSVCDTVLLGTVIAFVFMGENAALCSHLIDHRVHNKNVTYCLTCAVLLIVYEVQTAAGCVVVLVTSWSVCHVTQLASAGNVLLYVFS
jgi:hypothetical protein